jgi:hypothetical protein
MESPRLYYGGCSIAGTSLSQHTDLPCLAEGCCAKLLIFLLDKVFEGDVDIPQCYGGGGPMSAPAKNCGDCVP